MWGIIFVATCAVVVGVITWRIARLIDAMRRRERAVERLEIDEDY
jgi:hypothetical protein